MPVNRGREREREMNEKQRRGGWGDEILRYGEIENVWESMREGGWGKDRWVKEELSYESCCLSKIFFSLPCFSTQQMQAVTFDLWKGLAEQTQSWWHIDANITHAIEWEMRYTVFFSLKDYFQVCIIESENIINVCACAQTCLSAHWSSFVSFSERKLRYLVLTK